MRRVWAGLMVVGLSVGGCDDDALPREQIDTDGPTDDDDDGTTSGVDPTTSGPTTDPTPGVTTDDTQGPSTDPTPGVTTDFPDETTGGDDSTGTPSDPCSGATTNITQEGNVLASSVFDSLLGPAYEADLAVDGDVATSWFSAGPNEDGTESSYEWYTQFDHCIDGIALISNANHSNPDFREGFGFEAGTLEVLDTSGSVVYSADLDLSGTPDPDIVVEPEGVLGNQVRLTLRNHESEDCGGFAELAIDGRPQD